MSDVRWLSDDEQQVWRAFGTAIARLQDHLGRQLQQDGGMPPAYYEILVNLSEAPGRRLRMTELAERSRSSRSRLSHAIARLEANGWVEREDCPTDKRGSFALLTDKGFTALEAASPGHVTAVREHLFDVLTPEQVRQLGEISVAIRDGFSEQCAAVLAAECAEARAAAEAAEAAGAVCPDSA